MSSKKTQAEKLRAALIEANISRFRLAKLMEGEDAPIERVRNTKTQIAKWSRGKPGIGDINAVRIARAFNAIQPGRYDDAYFLRDPNRQPEWMQEIAKLVEQRQQDRRAYQRELRKLREELEVTRQEMFYEIERLKEAS